MGVLVCVSRPEFIQQASPYLDLAKKIMYLGAGLTAVGLVGSVLSRSRTELSDIAEKVKQFFISLRNILFNPERPIYRYAYKTILLLGMGLALASSVAYGILRRNHPINWEPPSRTTPPLCY